MTSREQQCEQINRELDALSRLTALPLRAWIAEAHTATEDEIAYAREMIRQARADLDRQQ